MSKRFERFVKGSAFIERSNGNIPYAEIISRLSKLEDIMAENDCLTPEELKDKIVSTRARLNSYKDFQEMQGFRSYEDFIGYVINTMLNKEEKANKITDLEAKLADKEEYIKMLEEDRATLNNIVEKYAKKCKNHNQDKIELLEKVKDYFCEEDEDGDGIKTGDWTITKDACEVAEYIDTLIKGVKGECDEK